ncbi:LysE family transporter [Tatumella sp. UBA2305]|uniref:LysE family transporter n=1 Tax=Tatumella sp. UBA2305 TaxID=1947647 RepID=UPI0025FF074E|nr:LysE family transporter [Tatumella sp. UBA2305]
MLFYLQGITLGAALILPLGPQNTLILNQGILRRYALMSASFCILSDVVLICAGVFGGSAVLQHSPLALQMITWAGCAFLLWYGWGTLRQALRPSTQSSDPQTVQQRRFKILLTLIAVTWLNPHVYLDTFVVLGSLGSQVPAESRVWFALGAVTASVVWFYALALLASALSPWLKQGRTQQVINLLVAGMMFYLAIRLGSEGVTMLRAVV